MQNQETLPQGLHLEQAQSIDWRLVAQTTLPVAYSVGLIWLGIQTQDHWQTLSAIAIITHASWAIPPYLFFAALGSYSPHLKQRIMCVMGALVLVLSY